MCKTYIVANFADFSYNIGMEVKNCQNKNDWEKSLNSATHHEFLQSWEWGEFQKSAGKEVLRLQVWDGSDVVGQMQGFVHNLGLRMRYLYVPRINDQRSTISDQVLNYIRDKFIFARIEPAGEFEVSGEFNFEKIKCRQPQNTLILDITKSAEELLADMHSKTRYNIRLAEKKGVEIRNEKNIDVFWKLNQETTDRNKFKSHDKKYYAKMLEMDIAYQLTAYYEDTAIASYILIKHGDTLIYLHGTSSSQHRNVMAPYLLQWEAIKFGQEQKCKYYDFWGIAKTVSEYGEGVKCFNNFCWQEDHRLAGVTRFKVGFGGKVKSYPDAVDVIFGKTRFMVYQSLRKVRKIFT